MHKKFIILISILLLLKSFAAYSQTSCSLDEAVQNTSLYLQSRLQRNSRVALIVIRSENQAALGEFVLNKISAALVNSNYFKVIVRDNLTLNVIKLEMEHHQSNQVSPETELFLGRQLGAQIIITGSFKHSGNNWRLDIEAINLETAERLGQFEQINIKEDSTWKHFIKKQKKKKEPNPKPNPGVILKGLYLLLPIGNDEEKFGSIGINVGSSFATPLFITNVTVTKPLFPYTFLEIGAEAGLFHGINNDIKIKDVKYNSWYYFGRFNVFLPFEKGGWYLGTGGGFMDAYYRYPNNNVSVKKPAFDTATGFFIGSDNHFFRIGYSLRTDFLNINHRVTLGYAFRIIE